LKYLVILAVLYLVYSFIKRQKTLEQATRNPSEISSPQIMVACARCGVHLPKSDALISPTAKSYCCAEHMHQGEQV
jgi:uncharacterized protein